MQSGNMCSPCELPYRVVEYKMEIPYKPVYAGGCFKYKPYWRCLLIFTKTFKFPIPFLLKADLKKLSDSNLCAHVLVTLFMA